MKLIRRVLLMDLPAGSLFLHGKTLALKTEYVNNGAIEAHIVGSGEAFWGGTQNADDLNKLTVTEVQLTDIPSSEEYKSSKEWYELIPEEYGVVIMDPDGWNRQNWDYSFNEELITQKEFKYRLSGSTVMCKTNFFNSKWWQDDL